MGSDSEAFETLIRSIANASDQQIDQMIDSFVVEQRNRSGFPIVDPSGDVIFVCRAERHVREVRLLGDFKTKNPFSHYWDSSGEVMSRVATEAPLFYMRMLLPPDAHINYAFRIDGKYSIDALNPRTNRGGAQGEEFDKASELRMPCFPLGQEVHKRDATPSGSVSILGKDWCSPPIHVYLPPFYDETIRYPVIYTADGVAWKDFVSLPTILDNLIASRTVPPVIAVMIEAPPDRATWHLWNADYVAYLHRCMEAIDGEFSTRRNAADRIHIGSCTGGRASFQVGLTVPELFQNIAMFSPSLSMAPHVFEPYLSGRLQIDHRLRVWLSAGSYEGAILKDVKMLDQLLDRHGVEHRVVITNEGHNFATWKNLVKPMLSYFLSTVQ